MGHIPDWHHVVGGELQLVCRYFLWHIHAWHNVVGRELNFVCRSFLLYIPSLCSGDRQILGEGRAIEGRRGSGGVGVISYPSDQRDQNWSRHKDRIILRGWSPGRNDCVAAVGELSWFHQSRYAFVGVAGVVVSKSCWGQGRRVVVLRRQLPPFCLPNRISRAWRIRLLRQLPRDIVPISALKTSLSSLPLLLSVRANLPLSLEDRRFLGLINCFGSLLIAKPC